MSNESTLYRCYGGIDLVIIQLHDLVAIFETM